MIESSSLRHDPARERYPAWAQLLTSFGETHYSGQIAVLHVDGNHNYENSHADMNAWCDLVMPGGWIVLDDYTWPFGDGPQRVGDEFLAYYREKIATIFTMDGALFIQLKKSIIIDQIIPRFQKTEVSNKIYKTISQTIISQNMLIHYSWTRLMPESFHPMPSKRYAARHCVCVKSSNCHGARLHASWACM